MPGTVYTVASGKGGVGKTTTTVNLGVALWQEGNAVAIVDADLGMANLSAVLGLEPETTLHDVLAGETILEEAIVEAKGGDLLVLPGSRELEGFAAANPQKLKDVLENLAARCDYVIVDTGAGLGYEDVLPLGLADAVILVSSADPASLGDTRKTAELADLVETPVMGVIVTRAVAGTDSEAIAGEIGAPLLGSIPEDPAVMEATVAGDPLASHAPNADATAAYMELGRAVLDAGARPSPGPSDDEPVVEDAAPEPDEAEGEEESSSAADTDGAAAEEATEDESEADATAATADEPEAATDEPAATEDPESTDPDADDEPEPAAEEPEPDVEEADESADEADEPTPATEDADDAEEADKPADAGESDDPAGSEEADEPADVEAVDESADDEQADEPADEVAAADDDSDGTDSADDDDGAEDESDGGSGGLGGWLGRLFS